MAKIPKKIKKLFYNPKTDSISDLVKDIKLAHIKILQNTDLSKGTLKYSLEDYELAKLDFRIPNEGLSKESFATMISDLYRGVPRWHSPNTMYNVAPPPLISTVVAKTFTSLYNPNLVLDTASGESTLTEQKVIRAIAEYIGWDRASAGGVFTFGGKATTMYGIKLGLKKCSSSSSAKGVKEDIIVLSTKSGHPSHISDAEWLGIGSSNVIRLNTDIDNRVDLNEMEEVVLQKTKEGKKIAAIIISGGTTNNMIVDPIKEVTELRDKLVKKLDLNYSPHIHVDSVVGFPWIFFKDYDFELNTLNISTEVKEKISKIIKDLRNLNCADSFGIDFHKMGFCPYISSLFMVKDKTSFSGLKDNFLKFGQNSPFTYSIENSRTGDGPNSAYIALNVLGVKGFQILISYLTEIATNLSKEIEETGHFEIINKMGLSNSVIFTPCIPKHIIFDNLEEETIIRNNYVAYFIDKIYELGNPYYIDKVPGNATGANAYPFVALKAYIMSPYSSKKSNLEFVSFVTDLKKKIDLEFNFENKNVKSADSEFTHPLK
jgi:glutamate/tyrosine decarboxylase-like PLP-dependent enzyme